MKFRSVILSASLLLAAPSHAEIKLPAILSDHMVLQQDKARVWGWATAGKTLTVSLAGQKATATVGPDGKWSLSFPNVKAGGPYDMVVSGDGSVTVTDILVGDVWVGSGQSNMEFTMAPSRDASTEIPKADLPLLRHFKAEHVVSFTPLDDLKGSWKVCTPGNVGEFSAVAYHFGKKVQQSLKVPVGLLVSCWGGTPAEAWVPRPALDKEPDLADLLKKWDSDEAQIQVWKNGGAYELQISDIRLVPKDAKTKPALLNLPNGTQGLGGMWSTNAKPGSTADYTVAGKGPKNGPLGKLSGRMEGGGWGGLQTPFRSGNAPMDLSGYETVEFYAKGNGKFRLKLGQSSISDYDYYATNVFLGPKEWTLMSFPIASLKQGGWGAPKPFTQDAVNLFSLTVEAPYWPDLASVVYNAMLAPLTPFAFKGVIWYQGESNTGRAGQYRVLLSALIKSWRENWKADFPFLIAQLPNYMEVRADPSDSGWAQLREAQLQVSQDIPGVGIVTTIDLGEANDIHPKNKKDVGERLALLALSSVYGKSNGYSVPAFEKAVVKDGKMVLTFKNVGSGLKAKDGAALTGFAISGVDGRFKWAKARITGKNVIEVSSPDINDPVGVRYAWADNPVCNLVTQEGYPASPFRFSMKPMEAMKPEPLDMRDFDGIPPPP